MQLAKPWLKNLHKHASFLSNNWIGTLGCGIGYDICEARMLAISILNNITHVHTSNCRDIQDQSMTKLTKLLRRDLCSAVWSYKIIVSSSTLICPHLPYKWWDTGGLLDLFIATSKRQGSEQPPRLICQNDANSYSSSPNTCPWEHSRLPNQPWAYTAWGEAWTCLSPLKQIYLNLSFTWIDFDWFCMIVPGLDQITKIYPGMSEHEEQNSFSHATTSTTCRSWLLGSWTARLHGTRIEGNLPLIGLKLTWAPRGPLLLLTMSGAFNF